MPTWNPNLAIGVKAIDAEHRELFGRAEALLAAMRERRSVQEVQPLLQFLDDYCAGHFQREEQLMRGKGYPGLTDHAARHIGFREQLQSLLVRFQARGATAAVTLETQELLSAIAHHIRSEDTKLAKFLERSAGGEP
jgi:hemerythrin